MDNVNLDIHQIQAAAASQPQALAAISRATNARNDTNPFDNESRIVSAYRNGTARTAGEKTFDGLTYWVNGFGTNLLLSTLITYFFVDNSVGRKGFEQMLKVAEKAGVSHKPTRETLARAFTLLLGGHITAIGVKVAEDNKLDLVKWLDKKFYGENAEDLPEVKAGHQHVAEESKPTWLNIAMARIICWGVIQAAAFSVGNKEKNLLMDFGKKNDIPVVKDFSVEGWSEVVGKRIADNTPKSIENAVNTIFKPLATSNHDQIYRKLLHYGAIDTLYTMITAALLKPVSYELRRLPGMKIDPKLEEEIESATHLPSIAFDHNPISDPASTEQTQGEAKADDTASPEKSIKQAKLEGIIQPPPLAAQQAAH